MKVLYAASEASPFIKVGGLSDVAGSLPRAMKKKGIDARVVIPLYGSINSAYKEKMTFIDNITVKIGCCTTKCGIYSFLLDDVTYYFIENDRLFGKKEVYGLPDDGERFAVFSKAVLDMLTKINFVPDIINSNDWHTALVPVYLDIKYRKKEIYANIKTVFSIHNIEFQGRYVAESLKDLFGIPKKYFSILDFDGYVNLMKGAIESSNRVVTVSKTYAKEILDPYYSHGLHPILIERKYKLSGIVNGIDTDLFCPLNDKNIAKNYSLSNIEDKNQNKEDLRNEMALPHIKNTPIIGMVTRLTNQKGLELMRFVMEQILDLDIQMIVLGTGDTIYEDFMSYFEYKYKDKMRAYIGFSNVMASKIYAGCDLFLMPSKSEPCGLSQLISLRYGTIPIVHSVGGLSDTVTAYNAENKTGNGITFQSFDALDMLNAIKRAVELYNDKDNFMCAQKNAMSGDYSWDNAVKKYISLYKETLGV